MTRQCVDFTGVEDGIVEPNENFTVTLTSDDEVDLTPDVAVVTIVEGVGEEKKKKEKARFIICLICQFLYKWCDKTIAS